ncbi:Ldh family oxidoreductase [Photobacterium profundum]|uniref:Ldh family oxidoreductase n=1 Tax=Photobacterium profundum TaxID=74109 RepID=UPI003D0D0BE8
MKVTYREAKELLIKKFMSSGLDWHDANWVTDVLVASEQRGDKSHGIKYAKNIIEIANSKSYVKLAPVIHNDASIAVLDGKNVIGPVAAKQAIEIAIKKAKKYGTAAVSLRSSNHLFSLSHYARYIASKNMIGFICSSSSPAMAAPNSSKVTIGTNLFSFGAPSTSAPIVMDMSSTQVARGRIKEYQDAGLQIPLSWAMDEVGRPTTCAIEALKGSLQPLGGYKGFAIGCMVDIFSSVLSGSAFSTHIHGTSLHKKERKGEINRKGDFFFVVDISKFIPLNEFNVRMDEFIKIIDSSGGYVPGANFIENQFADIEISEEILTLP